MQLLFKAFVFLVVLQHFCGFTQHAACQGDVHIVNLTLKTFGWPQTVDLTTLDKVVGPVVCPRLYGGTAPDVPSVDSCSSFLRTVAPDHIVLQARADASSFAESNAASFTSLAWVEGDTGDLLDAVTAAVSKDLDKELLVPTRLRGAYTVPCRGTDSTRETLPLCSSSNNCMTSIVVEGLQEKVTDVFCGYVPTPCENHVVSKSFADGGLMINITDVRNSLEIVLQFTHKVRNSTVRATRVQLYSHGRLAQLYPENETQLYAMPIKKVPHCSGMTGLWMLSLIGIIFLLFFLFRYLWWRGRHSAKKKERKIIIEEEMRAQGFDQSLSSTRNRYGQRFMGDRNEGAHNYLIQGQGGLYNEGYHQGEGEAGGTEAAGNVHGYTQGGYTVKSDDHQQYEEYDQMNASNWYRDMKEQYTTGQGEEGEYEDYDQGERGATASAEADEYGYTQEDYANGQYEEEPYEGYEQGMYNDAEYGAHADEFVDPGVISIDGNEAAYVEDNRDELTNAQSENDVDNKHVS